MIVQGDDGAADTPCLEVKRSRHYLTLRVWKTTMHAV